MNKTRFLIIVSLFLRGAPLYGEEKEENLWNQKHSSFYFGFHSDELRRYYSDSLTPLGRTENNIAELINSLKDIFFHFFSIGKKKKNDAASPSSREKS